MAPIEIQNMYMSSITSLELIERVRSQQVMMFFLVWQFDRNMKLGGEIGKSVDYCATNHRIFHAFLGYPIQLELDLVVDSFPFNPFNYFTVVTADVRMSKSIRPFFFSWDASLKCHVRIANNCLSEIVKAVVGVDTMMTFGKCALRTQGPILD